jgi:cysteine desulfurase
MIERHIGRPIYLDNHATTAVDSRVVQAMLPYFTERFGNPHSSSHFYGWEAAEAVEIAREQVAALIGADADEIFFSSGATEANNLALKGAAHFYRGRKNHIISVTTEHMCVLDSLFHLEREGFKVTYLEPGPDGLIDLAALETAITDQTLLVSIMAVQNEIGTIQPLAAIGALCRARGVFFHTDAAQAAAKISLDVKAMQVDLLSLTAHKFFGPMGIGALYVGKRPRVRLEPLFNGGGQEKNIRSGTVPAPLVAGFGLACEIGRNEMPDEARRVGALRDKLLARVQSVGGIHVNGSLTARVPGNLNISVEGARAEDLIAGLPELAFSTGSACSSASEESSYVLRAIGVSNDLADSSLRFGLGRFTSEAEIEYAGARLIEEITNVRARKSRAAE